ncbi:hypothetical protein [Emticicia sp. SJ17W-69]|uniref:hypothetical protein n=1 Tax=Emticicia sp. SJ17W-69 TaxID=3421657 RepID=UPI003EB6A4E5
MKKNQTLLFLILVTNTVFAQQVVVNKENATKKAFFGDFMDDYDIRYSINDSLWTQFPKAKYHVIKWNVEKQYIITKNDANNTSDKNLYTRIDYMTFENMPPYNWGFCLTTYDAQTSDAAEAVEKADRTNPRKGCNGFPFSRMKKVEK